MLGVPEQDDSLKYEANPKGEETSADLRSLLELADQVRLALGEDFVLVEKDGELVAVKAGSSSTGVWKSYAASVLVAALILTGAYLFRDRSRPSVSRHYRPPTPDFAHKFLSKHSVDPLLYLENKPDTKLPPLPAASESAKKSTRTPKAERPITLQGSLPIPSRALAPLAPNPGPLPDPTRVTVESVDEPKKDIHRLEARIREFLTERGGSVTRSSDGEKAHILYASVPRAQAFDLSDSLKARFGPSVHASEFGPDDSSPPDANREAEIKAAETSVASLKRQLEQAEIAFLPEAPALRGLRAQYGESLKALVEARKAAHPNVLLKVSISTE